MKRSNGAGSRFVFEIPRLLNAAAVLQEGADRYGKRKEGDSGSQKE